MSQFATKSPALPKGFISQEVPDVTYEGGEGFARDEKSELYLLSINFLMNPTFYEGKDERLTRLRGLTWKVTDSDPDWMQRFIPYLRNELNMRTAPIVLLSEYAYRGGPGVPQLIANTLLRADEPAELLGYWTSNYGRNVPMRVKKGLALAAQRLYNPYSYFKYRGTGKSVELADVIELTHPTPKDDVQSALFKYAIDVRRGRENIQFDVELLPALAARKLLAEKYETSEQRRALLGTDELVHLMKTAGVTWEWISSWINGPMDAKAWESAIPQMGYMALLRNLRNFDEAGISKEWVEMVKDTLTDPERVAESRQFPIRFFTAWANVHGLTWAESLETALSLSVPNVPELPGSTLVLVDVSGSMVGYSRLSSHEKRHSFWNKMHPPEGRNYYDNADIASVFGAAFAIKNAPRAKLVAFATDSEVVSVSKSSSILRTVEKIRGTSVFNGGTNAKQAIQRHSDGMDRIVLVTDEQFHPGPAIKFDGNIYVFNIGGYAKGGINTAGSGRYVIGGGLTDKAFEIVKILDQHRQANWPF